jgi:SAM-dependent methyltransferase
MGPLTEHGMLVNRRVNTPPQLRDVDRYNRRFYERCWRAASLLAMPGVWPPAKVEGLQVEIGCGLRPRLPLSEALFVDVSRTACTKLRRAGARVIRASIDALPFASGAVSQLYLFDILEHVSDDVGVGRELARVSAVNGWLVLSTPLHGHRWHEFDRVVGHARRYEPRALVDLLCGSGFTLERFARFGMRPRSSLLTRLGAYCMVHWPRTAFRFQERLLRLTQRRAQPTQLRRVGVAEFLLQVADADGAVTAWRHRRPD